MAKTNCSQRNSARHSFLPDFTLFKVTTICVVATLSRVHPSLDVLLTSLLILINSLIKPLLIKEKLSNQGSIEVHARSCESATNNGDYDKGKQNLEVI